MFLLAETGNVCFRPNADIVSSSVLAVASLDKLGYRATTTENALETVAVYREAMDSEDPFDLVILDLTIPGDAGGRDVIEQITRIDPSVKAVVCSGYSTDPVMAKFADYGFQGSISKPFRIRANWARFCRKSSLRVKSLTLKARRVWVQTQKTTSLANLRSRQYQATYRPSNFQRMKMRYRSKKLLWSHMNRELLDHQAYSSL